MKTFEIRKNQPPFVCFLAPRSLAGDSGQVVIRSRLKIFLSLGYHFLMRLFCSIMMLLMVFANTEAGKRKLTLDDIYHPDSAVRFSGADVPRLEWSASGSHLLKKSGFNDGVFTSIEALTGKEDALVDTSSLPQSLADIQGIDREAAVELLRESEFVISPGEDKVLVRCAQGLFLLDIHSQNLALLAGKPFNPRVPACSPSGRSVSFVSEGDLHLVEIGSGEVKRLTEREGDHILNGCLDWVYQEEVYGRGNFKGYWWSPDSQYLAFLQLDVSEVPVSTIVDQRSIPSGIEQQRYPYPGDPNARVRIGVVSIENGNVEWMDLKRFAGRDILAVRVDWSPGSDLLTVQVQDREQIWLELLAFNPENGKETLLIRETSPAWVNRLGEPVWLPDGTFLWQSERTGFRHIYHYSAAGDLIRAVTSGDFDVRALHAASLEQGTEVISGKQGTENRKKGTVFFSAAGGDFRDLHVYRVHLDGSNLERISGDSGEHRALFNRQGTLFVDTWSDVNTPPRVFLRRSDGSLVRTILENRVDVLESFQLSGLEFVQVEAGDGFLLEAMIIKPPDFDPSRKYPVLMHTYGGPGSQSVLNRWGGKTYMWHQFLASRGYIIWIFDDRIASGKGVRSAWEGYRNLGPTALRDIEDGIDWLAQHQWVDKERIGLWGWSYGGYVTAFALSHSDYFRIGIAGAPVTDWKYYDSIYTERFMGCPVKNRAGYESSSAVEAARNVHGRLLLLHGAMDDNVHLQNSVMLMEALQKAGIQFDFMMYPGSRHSVRDPLQVRQMRELMTRFILRHLDLPSSLD